MIRRLALAIAAAAALLGPLRAGGQMVYEARSLPERSALNRLGLERGWSTAVPLRPGVETLLNLSLSPDGTMLFAQTDEAKLYAFEAETGRLIWHASLGERSGQAQDVGTNGDLIFATNSQFLYAIDRNTGRFVWIQRLEANPSSPTVGTDEYVMVGLETGKLVAYSLVPYENERFRLENGPPGGFAWAFQTNGPLTGSPIPSEFVVAFASNGGKVYVSLLDPLQVLHRSQPMGAIRATMGTYGTGPDSALLVPSMDGNLYHINLFTGDPDWVFPTGAPIAAEPLIGGGDVTVHRTVARTVPKEIVGPDLRAQTIMETVYEDQAEVMPMPPTVYVLNEAGRLYAVDPVTGSPRWDETGTRTGAERIIALSPSRVYMRSLYGDLAIVERDNGELVAGPADTHQRAGLNLRNYVRAVTNDVNDRIFLGSKFGSIVCIHEQGLSRPVALRELHMAPFGHLERGQGAATATPPDAPAAEPAPPAEAPADDNPFDFGFGSRPVRRIPR